jgi:hypothetical protein
MKALLTTNYIHVSNFIGFKSNYQQHLDFKTWIKENQGKWIDIDTQHIFNNQYNTISGYRIYDTYIDQVIDDVRTDKDVFFVNHPKGKDPIKKVDFRDHLKNERFSSCHSVNSNYYRISRRSSIEFILVGELVYITNSIGYTLLKKSRLTNNEKAIVNYCANRILTNNI